MILAIDIGNTNIVLGCVEGKKTFFIERLSTDKAKTELEYAVSLKNVLEIYEIPVDQIEGGIISSVVPQVTELPECGRKSHQKAGQSGWTRREDRS